MKAEVTSHHRKTRFFAVRENFHIDYYEDEEKFKAGAKPKGTMILEGYRVVSDPNARKVEHKKAVNAKFNIDEDVGEYAKYEPLTIECYHDARRRWLLKAKDQAEFDTWVAVLSEAAERCKGRTLTDPLKIEAFDSAFQATKLDLALKPKTVRAVPVCCFLPCCFLPAPVCTVPVRTTL